MKHIRNILIALAIILTLAGLGLLVWWLWVKIGAIEASTAGTAAITGAAIAKKKLSKQTEPKNSTTPASQPLQIEAHKQQQKNEWGEYRATVRRKSKTSGPGTFTLYKGSEVVGEWSCITGGKITDPAAYGGLTPTTTWVMIEPIQVQTHPTSGSRFRFSRIVPVGQKEKWKNRTFDPERWPFMIHYAGTSTGCIAILPKDWRNFYETVNAAFSIETFPITVEEIS